MRPTTRRAPARFILALALALASAVAPQWVLSQARYPAHVEVAGTRIRLGDVLRDVPASLAATDLGDAPEPGASRLIVRDDLLRAFAAAGITPAATLPAAVRVTRRTRVLSPAELERLLRGALTPEAMPRGATLRAVRPGHAVAVPGGFTHATADLARPPRRTGRFATTATLALRQGDAVLARVLIPIELDLSRDAATPDVARGAAIQLVVSHGLVEVTAPGTTVADGNLGDTVPVTLRPSGRVVLARLVTHERAELREDP